MYRKIAAKFGERVAQIVQGCSDTDETPKPPWLLRKQGYIGHVAAASPSVRLVSMCDKVHNIRCILADLKRHGPDVFSRFSRGMKGTVWYYRALADAFAAAQPPVPAALLDELHERVAELERLTGVDGRKVDVAAL